MIYKIVAAPWTGTNFFSHPPKLKILDSTVISGSIGILNRQLLSGYYWMAIQYALPHTVADIQWHLIPKQYRRDATGSDKFACLMIRNTFTVEDFELIILS